MRSFTSIAALVVLMAVTSRSAVAQETAAKATTPSKPVAIDDRALLTRLTVEGKRLIDDGLATEISELKSQLDRATCRIELPELKTKPSTPAELYAKARRSVVIVGGLYKCGKCTRWHSNVATGFAVTSGGVVATNYHVIDSGDKKTLVVMTADGRVLPVKEVLAASRANDVALLKVDATDLTPLPIAADSSAAPVGSYVGVVGHPGRRFYTYTSGVVSRYLRDYSQGLSGEFFAITADYAKGSSGGPVLNNLGQVVGMVQKTQFLYADSTNGQRKNLQMVMKICVPATSLRKLIAGERDLPKTAKTP